jgi:hypothetical protein
MGSELANHADDPPATYHALVRDELEEEHWFNRRLEVFRDTQRVGGSTDGARLLRFASGNDGACLSGDVRGALHRVCVVQVAPWSIVVATPYAPILWSMAPLLATIVGAAGLAAFAFSLLAGRVSARALLPLARFERDVAAIPAMGRKERVASTWEAEEIDALARTFNDLLARTEVAMQREQLEHLYESIWPLVRAGAELRKASVRRRQRAHEAPARVQLPALSCVVSVLCLIGLQCLRQLPIQRKPHVLSALGALHSLQACFRLGREGRKVVPWKRLHPCICHLVQRLPEALPLCRHCHTLFRRAILCLN